MTEEEKLEFERFEIVRKKLTHVFVDEYKHPEADRLGFCVAQSIRDVPALLRLLDDNETHSNDEILEAVHAVVANHFSMTEANRLLTSITN